MAVEAHGDRINIQEYADANPDSELLARMSESVRDTGYTYFEGWWDAFTAEHGAGALPADAAVAAYFSVMHPTRQLAMPERPKDYGTDFIPALPYIYQLYPETTEARIRSLASADGIEEHEQLLEDAVDAIRGTSQGS